MESSVEVIGLDEVGQAAVRLINNQVSGRIVIDVNR